MKWLSFSSVQAKSKMPLLPSIVIPSKVFLSNMISLIGISDLIIACKAFRKKSVLVSLPNVALNRSGEPPVI